MHYAPSNPSQIQELPIEFLCLLSEMLDKGAEFSFTMNGIAGASWLEYSGFFLKQCMTRFETIAEGRLLH